VPRLALHKSRPSHASQPAAGAFSARREAQRRGSSHSSFRQSHTRAGKHIRPGNHTQRAGEPSGGQRLRGRRRRLRLRLTTAPAADPKAGEFTSIFYAGCRRTRSDRRNRPARGRPARYREPCGVRAGRVHAADARKRSLRAKAGRLSGGAPCSCSSRSSSRSSVDFRCGEFLRKEAMMLYREPPG